LECDEFLDVEDLEIKVLSLIDLINLDLEASTFEPRLLILSILYMIQLINLTTKEGPILTYLEQNSLDAIISSTTSPLNIKFI
jgi:hypothetical protein